MNSIQLKLCDIQGRLFELAEEFSSEEFIKGFMNSEVAVCLDSPYNKLQWMGEEYLLEALLEEKTIGTAGEKYGREVMFWAGYLYRYWQCLTGESSRKIYRQAPAGTMKRNYMMFHTMDPETAIEDLREMDRQKNRMKQKKR